MTNEEAFHTLSFYTLSHPDTVYFIHQHVVDAYTAQTADQSTKPISLFFSVIGLYLFAERNYSGRQVQKVHMELARTKSAWPQMEPAQSESSTSIHDVLSFPEGELRDTAIKEWSRSVWGMYSNNRNVILSYLQDHL